MEHSARKFRFPRAYSRTRLHILIAYFMGKVVATAAQKLSTHFNVLQNRQTRY